MSLAAVGRANVSATSGNAGIRLATEASELMAGITWDSESESVIQGFNSNGPSIETFFASKRELLAPGPLTIAEVEPVEDFLHRLISDAEHPDYGDPKEAAAWRGLAKLLSTLSDLTLSKQGPADDDGTLAEDDGAYLYAIYGKTAEGGLAGVWFKAVET